MTDVPNADSLTGLTRNRQILPLIVSSFFFLSDFLVCLPFIYLPLAFSSIFYQFVTTRRNFVIDILRAIYWAAMWFVGKCVFPIYDSASGARRRIFFNETEKVRKRNAKRQREGEIVLRSLDVSYLICAYRLPKSKSILRGLCLLLARLHPSFVLFFFFYIYITMELGRAGETESRERYRRSRVVSARANTIDATDTGRSAGKGPKCTTIAFALSTVGSDSFFLFIYI